MSQSSSDNFNTTIGRDAIRLVEQFERDEALARQLQNGTEFDFESPGPTSSTAVIGRSVRITTDLPPINEDVIDLTGSDDEEDEDENNESMDTSHNTTAESAASRAHLQALVRDAERLIQEMDEEDERDRSPIRSIHPQISGRAPGTSGQVRSNANEHRRNAMSSPPRRQPDNLPEDSEEEDTGEALLNASSSTYDSDDSFINALQTNNRVGQASSSIGATPGASTSALSQFRPPAFTRPTAQHSAVGLGLRQDQINRLPSQSLDETIAGDTCPVCMDDMATNNEIRRLPCLHVLHKGCIDPWLKKSKECPICKFDISSAM
ncbi:Oidioi.mRNA.OKI2018_I69.PAR.g12965.t1.cds [Oikopleura dioica]|uniref:Oidioi.mRNA.OKI2018_I69.PAR.g12965.t1.cds n=1 Tax=Oikopleura dioica TaxID=34765 RepID=A0ABN7S373_OIKDI|nr:Oidioi.mRNA.OKI2018_I69.PAR.g12965.t1.cds [Oikopleura dioica]